MPPVRWKLLTVLATCFLQHFAHGDGTSSQFQDSAPMSSDGWRPIMGTSLHDPPYPDEITQYRNPSQSGSKIEAATVQRPTTPSPIYSSTKPTIKTSSQPQLNIISRSRISGKIPTPNKHLLLMMSGNHGPHIPLRGPPSLRVVMSKPHGLPKKRPIKLPHLHEDIFAASPSTAIGSYTFFNPGHGSLKPRDNSGPPKHYHIQQPQIEYFNNFPASSFPRDDVYQVVRNSNPYFIQKDPSQNDVHFAYTNDEYTKNLVPPPVYKFTDEKNKKPLLRIKDSNEPTINNPQVIIGKPKNDDRRTPNRENIVVQLPPSLHQPNLFELPDQQQQTNNEQGVDLQVTKEKFNVFQNSIPPNYDPSPQQYQFNNYQTFKPSKTLTYEVTEGKNWQFYDQTLPTQSTFRTQAPLTYQFPTKNPEYHSTQKVFFPQKISQPQIELQLNPFLPTPFRPESSPPTSPTQGEISTIFTELSTRQKPGYFNVQEVSTHYPILGNPVTESHKYPTEYSISPETNSDLTNEITTQTYQQESVPILPIKSTVPTRDWQTTPSRHNQRRRRPQRPRTTTTEEPEFVTETYESSKMEPYEQSEEQEEISYPVRNKKPTRYRTTTPPEMESYESEEETTRPPQQRLRKRPGSNRYSARHRVRPTVMESTENSDEVQTTTTEAPKVMQIYKNGENVVNGGTQFNKDDFEEPSEEYEIPTKKRIKTYQEEVQKEVTKTSERPIFEDQSDDQTEPYIYKTENVQEINRQIQTSRNRIRLQSSLVTTEQLPTTNVKTPENEIDYSTTLPEISVQEVTQVVPKEETTIMTTTSTTTTTTTPEPTTTKSNRLRGRPIKYSASNRPRFSVKDYRQRLNQYTSTTTESSRSDNPRIRYPNRSRRPIVQEEDTTEPARSKFSPRESKYSTTTETPNEVTIADRPHKSVNTRLRPFGRYRTSTEPSITSTQKVSIKPNIFSNLKRPTPISLKMRIYNRYQRNNTKPSEEPPENTSESDPVATTAADSQNVASETATEFDTKKIEFTPTVIPSIVTTDILKNDSTMQSQFVSDLTVSAKKEYDTPGLFKSVSPTSRRVPNYFTISTDDPILPIEAFFPSIKEKEKY